MADFPIAQRRVGHAHDRVEHVPLADTKGRNVDEAVPVLRQAGARVVPVVRQDLQAEQVGDAAAALGHGARVDAGVAVVEQGDGAVREVEAVEVGTGRQAVLVPEIAGDADPGALAQLFDVRAEPGVLFANGDVLEQAWMGMVVAVLVGKDPGHVGRRRGVDEPHLRLWRSPGSHGDDERILTPKRLHEGCLVGVVDFLDLHASWHRARARALCASNGRDFVLSDFEQLLHNEFADPTASLSRELNWHINVGWDSENADVPRRQPLSQHGF